MAARLGASPAASALEAGTATDLRLAPAAGLAWASAWLLTGVPPVAAPAAVVAWLLVAATLLALLASAGSPAARRYRPAIEFERSARWGASAPSRVAGGGRGDRPSRLHGRARRWLPGVTLAAAAAGLVCTSVFALGHLRHPGSLDSDRPLAGSAVVTITGVAKPAQGGGAFAGAGERITVDGTLESFTTGASHIELRAPALVFATLARATTLPIGSTVRVAGTLTALPPGESHEFLLFGRGQPQVERAPPWYLSWAHTVRQRFRAVTSQLPGDGADLLAGLAVGDDSAVESELHDAMTVSGLTHLTAVSGANCAIVVSAVMLGAGAVGLGRRIRVAVSVLVLVLFVILVTPEPSVLRAATMAVIVLIALATGRPSGGLPPLCLSVIVLLALDPWLGRSAGFALSVLATAGLLLLTRPLAAVLRRFLPPWLALAVSVPVAAQLACQPVLFLLSPQITPYTVPANMLAEPAAAAVSVLGLVVCILAVVAPPLGALAAWLPWVPSAWIAAVARFFAAAPFAAIPVPDGALAAAAAIVLTALFLLAVFSARRHPLVASVTGVLTAVGLVAGGGALIGTVTARDAAVPHDWQIAACDIGQGDAVLLRSREVVALVDVGPDPEPLTACLRRLHLSRIDLLVLTHYDRDHVGGLDAVLGLVDTALVGPADGPADERLLADLRDGGAEVVHAARGQNGTLGDYHWDVLWPRAGTGLSGNDASVTMLFTGPLRALFLGDLGEQAQDAVRAANQITPVDVVKVAHHGSADQSERLYGDLRAPIALISVGADNSYGHPTDRLLGILGRVGSRPFRTDLEGLVVVSGTSAAPTVWTETRAPPRGDRVGGGG